MGGADLSISRIINGLNSNLYDIEFISINRPKIKDKIKKKIKYRIFNSKRTLTIMYKIKKYLNEDNKYKKKIFISNQNFANTLSIFFLRGIKNLKIILFERNHLDELSYFKGFKDFLKKKIIKILIKLLYRKADLVITNSIESSKKLSDYSNINVRTLYNPSFFGFRASIKKNKSQNKKLNILNVARFHNQKDQITLLKAFNRAKYKNKFILNLVGFGPLFSELKNYAKKNDLKNVNFFKNKFHLDKFYKKADLFILSSLYEGFPNVLIEAASYRIPIISSNFKSGSKEILLNGDGGSIFKVGDYKKLSHLIDEFYLNKNKFLVKEKNCAKSLKRFSNKKILLLFDKILTSFKY